MLGPLGAEKLAERAAVLSRGIARGELPPHTDVDLVSETIFGTVFNRLHRGETLDLGFCSRLIDLVLAGARAPIA